MAFPTSVERSTWLSDQESSLTRSAGMREFEGRSNEAEAPIEDRNPG